MDLEITKFCEKVAQELGKGYAECVYQEALCVHLRSSGYRYSKEATLDIVYNEVNVGSVRADIIINDKKNKYVIECKAIDANLRINYVPQILCYMRLTGINTGVMVNFNQNPNKPNVEYIYVTKCGNYFQVSLNGEIYKMTESGSIMIDEI